MNETAINKDNNIYDQQPVSRTGKKMTYQQVRDVIERIREVHQQLRDILEEDRTRSADNRTQYFLKLLRREEQSLQVALAKYETDADEGVLDTWLQYVPDEEITETLSQIEFTRDMSVEEIVETKVRFDQALIAFFKQLRDQTSVPRVEELFGSLLEQAETQVSQDVWEMREFTDGSAPPEPE